MGADGQKTNWLTPMLQTRYRQPKIPMLVHDNTTRFLTNAQQMIQNTRHRLLDYEATFPKM